MSCIGLKLTGGAWSLMNTVPLELQKSSMWPAGHRPCEWWLLNGRQRELGCGLWRRCGGKAPAKQDGLLSRCFLNKVAIGSKKRVSLYEALSCAKQGCTLGMLHLRKPNVLLPHIPRIPSCSTALSLFSSLCTREGSTTYTFHQYANYQVG